MGKIFTFWSPCHSAGTTTTAILMANQLSKKYSVCLIDLDLVGSDVGFLLKIYDTEHNIDNLGPYIMGNAMTGDIFKSNLVMVKKFYVLQGTKNTERSAFFKQEEIEPIIDMAKNIFDIVILNVSPTFDNIATFLALQKADATIIVMQQKLTHFNKLNKKMPVLLSLCERCFVVLSQNSKSLNIPASDIYNVINIKVYPLEGLDERKITNALNLEKNLIDVYFDNKTKLFSKNVSEIANQIEEIIASDDGNIK